MRRRLALLAVVSLAALAAADLWLGGRIADGVFRGLPVPPLGVLDAQTRASLERRVARARRGLPPPPRALLRFSPRYGWVNHPGREEVGGSPVTIDADGARSWGEGAAAPSPDGPWILCFGESFTFGSEVRDGEDWPALLRALEPSWNVRNYGVGAWGTDQALLRFREIAPERRPDVVVLGFLVENVGRNVNRYRQLYQAKDAGVLVKPRFRLEGDALVLVPVPYATELEVWEAALDGSLREALGADEWWVGDDPLLPFSSLSRIWSARRAFARRRPWNMWSHTDEEPVQLSLALLEAFHREALALGARAAPILVFQSEPEHDHVRAHGDRPFWTVLHDELDRRGIPYLDTYPTMEARLRVGEPTYLRTHHSPEANRAIAELLHAWLLETVPDL